MTTIGCEQALGGALRSGKVGGGGETRGGPFPRELASRRILGGRKLLVYVRTTVTAIFDVMTEVDQGE